jgi:hypothetical protein
LEQGYSNFELFSFAEEVFSRKHYEALQELRGIIKKRDVKGKA